MYSVCGTVELEGGGGARHVPHTHNTQGMGGGGQGRSDAFAHTHVIGWT